MGRLFREFAITLGITIVISAVVSLTLTPMMCAKLLKYEAESEQGRFYRSSQRAFDRVIGFYGRTLAWVLKHQRPTLWVTLSMLVLTVALFGLRAQGFLSGPGHGGHPGHVGSASIGLILGHGRTSAGPRTGDPQGPGRGEFVVFYRHRRNEYHLKQRPDSHQPETPFKEGREGKRDYPAPRGRSWPRWRGLRSTCSLYRTLPSTHG